MDTIDRYRELVKKILTEHAQYKPAFGEVRTELIFDEAQEHYQFGEVGWDGFRRIEGVIIHVDIINGKIWIQHDGTEHGIARELEALGVPRSDIVLGFHHPAKRPLTEYAAA